MKPVLRQKIIEIAKIVCDYYDVNFYNLSKKCRKKELVLARQVSWLISRNLFQNEITYSDLGLFIGKRDHACVIHGIQKLDGWLRFDKSFTREYNEILQNVNETLNFEVNEITRIKREIKLAIELTDIIDIKKILINLISNEKSI